jgi:hypothetical protein
LETNERYLALLMATMACDPEALSALQARTCALDPDTPMVVVGATVPLNLWLSVPAWRVVGQTLAKP